MSRLDPDRLLDDQRERWARGERVRAEDYRATDPDLSQETLLDLLFQEVLLREEGGDKVPPSELERRFPQLADEVRKTFATHAIPGYELVEVLGRGGMGVVYKARQTSLDRAVALKFLTPGREGPLDPQALARFQQEARTASALNHPHICTIHDLGAHEGEPFIAMELIAGRTLHALLKEGPVPEAERIVRQAAEALGVAHAAGIVHRDIKPDNIMVRADGYAKVLDFGLARLISGVDWARGEAGVVVGTPRYMSPEQLRGEPVGAPSDVFSLGLVWYEIATGRHPFAGPSLPATIEAIQHAEPASPATLSPSIAPATAALMLRMLAKTPRERPTMDVVIALLGGTVAKAARRWWWPAVAALAALAAIVVWLSAGRAPAPSASVPSLAVMPFERLGDETQSYLSDGVSEDITAMLARAPDLTVLAPGSVAGLRGKDARTVHGDLGVDYVLEGRVQKAADKVRIIVHLIDGRTGKDVWSERFDKTGADPWQLQDEIAGRIVAALTGELGQVKRSQYRATWGADTTSFAEYDWYLRGHEAYARYTLEGNDKATVIWAEGLKEFPHSALLMSKLAWCHFMRPYNYYVGDDTDYARAWALLLAAEAEEQQSPLARRVRHWLLSYMSAQVGDHARALREVETTRALAPYDAFMTGDLASPLILVGHVDEALLVAAKSREKDPANKPFYRQLEGWGLSVAGRYAESQAALAEANDLLAVPLLQAVNQVQLGDIEGARRSVAAALKRHPAMTRAAWARASFYRDRAVLERQLDALAKAGLP